MQSEPLFRIEVPVPAPALDAVANRLHELGIGSLQWEDGKIPCNLITYVYGDERSRSLIEKIENYIQSITELFPDQAFGQVRKFQIDSEEWAHEWKKYFKPTKISEFLVVKPTWKSYTSRQNEIVIDIDPEMAFGTGTHESTFLCLQALENIFKSNPFPGGCRFLDLGTGTGILAIASIRLGAGTAVGIDIDPIAIETAKRNAELNHVGKQCDFSTKSLGDLDGRFDVILANINSDTLCSLAPAIAEHQTSGGLLVLSGIMNERAKEVKTCFLLHDYQHFHRETLNEWTLWQARRGKVIP